MLAARSSASAAGREPSSDAATCRARTASIALTAAQTEAR
jgi:hypothetical protein